MKLLTVKEAAERLGISDRRVRILIKEGKLAAHKLGREHAIEEGALATIHRTNVNVNREVLAQIQKDFDNLTLETTIPHTATLVEASASHQTILDYAHGSKGHRAYEQLAEEIIRRVERPIEQQQAQAQV